MIPFSLRSRHGTAYTFLVRFLRIFFPLVAVVMIGVVMAKIMRNPFQAVQETALRKDQTAAGEIRVSQAQYDAVDAKGRPYWVRAESAKRMPGQEQQVFLDKIAAEMKIDAEQRLALTADQGQYDMSTQNLALSHNVEIRDVKGHCMTLKEILIDLRQRSAVSQDPVHAEGPLGTAAAQGLTVREDGNVVILKGPVRVVASVARGPKP